MFVILLERSRGHDHRVIGCHHTARQDAVFFDEQDIIALQRVVGPLVTHTADHDDAARMDPSEQVTGQNILFDHEILDRAVDFLKLEAVEIREKEVGRFGVAG